MAMDQWSKRRVLTKFGTIGVVGVAGCESPAGERDPTSDGTRNRTPSLTEEQSVASTEDPQQTPRLTVSDGEPVDGFPIYEGGFMTERIGSRADITNPESKLPHELLIWNPTDQTREITVEIRNLTNGEEPTVLNDTYEIPEDELLVIRLLEPATYRVSLAGPTIDETATIDIPRSRFDCNESHHEITVTGTGEVAEVVYSDTAMCSTSTAE